MLQKTGTVSDPNVRVHVFVCVYLCVREKEGGERHHACKCVFLGNVLNRIVFFTKQMFLLKALRMCRAVK